MWRYWATESKCRIIDSANNGVMGTLFRSELPRPFVAATLASSARLSIISCTKPLQESTLPSTGYKMRLYVPTFGGWHPQSINHSFSIRPVTRHNAVSFETLKLGYMRFAVYWSQIARPCSTETVFKLLPLFERAPWVVHLGIYCSVCVSVIVIWQ